MDLPEQFENSGIVINYLSRKTLCLLYETIEHILKYGKSSPTNFTFEKRVIESENKTIYVATLRKFTKDLDLKTIVDILLCFSNTQT